MRAFRGKKYTRPRGLGQCGGVCGIELLLQSRTVTGIRRALENGIVLEDELE